MVGKYDHKFRAINTEIAELCLVAKLTVISESGHNIHWENPIEWIETIINFLIKGRKNN